jgi:O-antigen/teichoic acid export membrane protein
VNLAGAVIIRRGFGLESGVYDVALGLLNTLLVHIGLGVPSALSQYVPVLERTGGRAEVARFVRFVTSLRFGMLFVALALLNVFAVPVAEYLHLDTSGVWLLRIVSLLTMLRAGSDLAVRALQAMLAHFLANIVQLVQALTLVAVAAWALWRGGSIASVFSGLTVTAVVVTLWSAWIVRREVSRLPAQPAAPAPTDFTWGQFWRFSLFRYVLEGSRYFATPAFASPTLAVATGGPAMVALFNVAFQFPMMVVVLSVAGLQGLYRPLFAQVLAENAPERVRTLFAEISKIEALLLIPSGVGLLVLLPDYIPLLFTEEFAAAVPIAQLLCVIFFLETLFNLPNVLLAVDERYAMALAVQGLRIVGVPAFVWLAVRGELFLATAAFGVGRLLAAGLGVLVSRRLYDVRFPGGFAVRVCLATAVMAVVVAVGRFLLPESWLTTTALTLFGALVAMLGMIWFRVLGPREIDILRRAGLPGSSLVLRWFPDDRA